LARPHARGPDLGQELAARRELLDDVELVVAHVDVPRRRIDPHVVDVLELLVVPEPHEGPLPGEDLNPVVLLIADAEPQTGT
jgi:hypothetical protein